ncbi:hypothetical protein ACH5RR_017042 [Cinchona calisaya]|uniref:BHLH domain-containing protein n=1 Tax=Cinchona calisaya TaxID=153742 RepID=A0ABD3A3B1_9GENT
MYPLQQSNELENQIPYTPRQPDNILLHDLITFESCSNPLHHHPAAINSPGKKTQQIAESKEKKKNQDNEFKLKRIIHRDIERQRRQEMANLYSSLRSLLPLEYIKGKRAISDHMHEAVNYINCLQKKIGELRERRESLMKKTGSLSSTTSSGNGSAADSCLPNCLSVTVNPCRDGVEILISSGPKEEKFSLSRVLKKLLDEGQNVVSCVSTKANEITVHKILSEVPEDWTSIHVMSLQQKLTNAINLDSNSE